MGSRAKNHHYVPRSYLARFADDQGFLHVYDRAAKELRKQRPKEVMKINSYYRQEWAPEGVDPNVLETSLGEWLEAEAKNAIDKLHSIPEELDAQDIANLLIYFEIQRVRVPRQAEMGKALMRDLILQLAPPDAVEAIAAGKFKLEMKDAARFDYMRHSIGTLSPWFGTMEWEVVTAGDGASFVTTDSPLSLYNPATPPPAEAGIGLAGTKVFFPLSSSKVLLMRHREYANERKNPTEILPIPEHEDGHIEIISGAIWPTQVVDRFNWKLLQLCSNLVVANSPSVIQRCVDANAF
jgi:hypothetical protein